MVLLFMQKKGERMSEKNFTIYATGGTNVFIPVLSDDPKQVSRVLDSLKKMLRG